MTRNICCYANRKRLSVMWEGSAFLTRLGIELWLGVSGDRSSINGIEFMYLGKKYLKSSILCWIIGKGHRSSCWALVFGESPCLNYTFNNLFSRHRVDVNCSISCWRCIYPDWNPILPNEDTNRSRSGGHWVTTTHSALLRIMGGGGGGLMSTILSR